MEAYIRFDNRAAVASKLKQAIATALDVTGAKIETKAKQNCPVDTGRLRNSITHQMQGDTSVVIGSNVEYAKFVELGTSRRRATPYLKPAAETAQSDFASAIKSAM